MKLLALMALFLFSSCSSWIDLRRTNFEDCVIKMRANEIPPMKALEICRTIHGDTSSKDFEDTNRKEYHDAASISM